MLLTNVWHTYVKHLAGRSENFCPWKNGTRVPSGSGSGASAAETIPSLAACRNQLTEFPFSSGDLAKSICWLGGRRLETYGRTNRTIRRRSLWPPLTITRRTRQYTRRVACVTYFVRDGPPLPSARSKDYIFFSSSFKSTANEKMYTRLSLYCKRQIPLTYYSGRDSDNKSIEENSLYNIVNIKSIFLR